jgi:peptidoglycan hydrolase CwlO-like protein
MKKTRIALLILLIMILTLPSLNQVLADSNVASYNVSLSYVNVQLSYPAELQPGQTVTINVQATAKRGVHMNNLTVQVLYTAGNNLKLLTTYTVWQDSDISSGALISKTIQAIVPQDAPRTSLMALVSESVRIMYYYIEPYDISHQDNETSSSISTLYPFGLYYDYLQYDYTDKTDGAIAPLSYIKATTSEYVSLQSDYQSLQQKLDQAQSDNQKLQQNLQAQQNAISQRDSTIANLNQQLASVQGTITPLEIIIAVLAGLVIILGAYAWRLRSRTPNTTSNLGTAPQ